MKTPIQHLIEYINTTHFCEEDLLEKCNKLLEKEKEVLL